jgi:hypothetical protein
MSVIMIRDGAWEIAVCEEKSPPLDKNCSFDSLLQKSLFVHFLSQWRMKKKTSKKYQEGPLSAKAPHSTNGS